MEVIGESNVPPFKVANALREMKRIEEEQRRRERLEEERRQREEEARRLAEDEAKKTELEEAQRYVSTIIYISVSKLVTQILMSSYCGLGRLRVT